MTNTSAFAASSCLERVPPHVNPQNATAWSVEFWTKLRLQQCTNLCQQAISTVILSGTWTQIASLDHVLENYPAGGVFGNSITAVEDESEMEALFGVTVAIPDPTDPAMAGKYLQVQLRVNGAAVYTSDPSLHNPPNSFDNATWDPVANEYETGTFDGWAGASSSSRFNLVAGDVVSLWAYQDSGLDLSTIGGEGIANQPGKAARPDPFWFPPNFEHSNNYYSATYLAITAIAELNDLYTSLAPRLTWDDSYLWDLSVWQSLDSGFPYGSMEITWRGGGFFTGGQYNWFTDAGFTNVAANTPGKDWSRDDVWHHVCSTWDLATGDLKIYFDGVLADTMAGVTGGRTWNQVGILWSNTDASGLAPALEVGLAFCAMYDGHALSAAEIANHFNYLKMGPGDGAGYLAMCNMHHVSHIWPLDDPAGVAILAPRPPGRGGNSWQLSQDGSTLERPRDATTNRTPVPANSADVGYGVSNNATNANLGAPGPAADATAFWTGDYGLGVIWVINQAAAIGGLDGWRTGRFCSDNGSFVPPTETGTGSIGALTTSHFKP